MISFYWLLISTSLLYLKNCFDSICFHKYSSVQHYILHSVVIQSLFPVRERVLFKPRSCHNGLATHLLSFIIAIHWQAKLGASLLVINYGRQELVVFFHSSRRWIFEVNVLIKHLKLYRKYLYVKRTTIHSHIFFCYWNILSDIHGHNRNFRYVMNGYITLALS